ncbi:MAG: hypothetical protein OWS74_02415, partial [Firmicutes bacterium]|nr:hypothetical protein [Bacillota bacterium]
VGGFKPLWQMALCYNALKEYQKEEAVLLTTLRNYSSFRPAWQAFFTLLRGNPPDQIYQHLRMALPAQDIASLLGMWNNLGAEEIAVKLAAEAEQRQQVAL